MKLKMRILVSSIVVILCIGILHKSINRQSSSKTLKIENNKTKILIISQWRSGSTLFGSVIQDIFKDKVMRMHEPFHGFKLINSYKFRTLMTKDLKDIYNCNFHEIKNLLEHFNETKPFQRYFAALDANLRKTCMFKLQKKCDIVKAMEETCHKAEVLSVKVVRYPVEFVRDLLLEHPDLKVFLLARDPRYMVASRNRANWCKEICSNITFMCSNMLENIQHALKLAQEYPKQIKIIRYEDVIGNRIIVESEIVDFVNGPRLKNSKKLMARFKEIPVKEVITKLMSESKVKEIETLCADVLDYYGYNKNNYPYKLSK